ncbi:MAG: hypothetical protein LBU70_05270 [Chitinispirillales bacterium]|nr:hypothetical protein [Chitinispirillales bacterium]
MTSNILTGIFIFLIVLSLFWGLLDKYLRKKDGILQANIAVSLGMLGTFCGILWALQGFDENNIQDSIPQLLGGMRTVFQTSIAGMLAYIILKSISRHTPKTDISKGESEAETIIILLGEVAKNSKDNSLLMKNIEKSISGDGETTLLTNIQKLRTTTLDGLTELNKSFKEFAEKQAENNSKALIEALEDVMRDFNSKINEQFGDNFKRLNEAVAKLLEWQENYKEQVEKMTEQFNLASKGITECKNIVEKLTKDASVYHETSIKLEKILKNLNTNLVGIENLAQKAEEAFPMIEKNIKNITDDVAYVVKESIDKNNEMLVIQRHGIEQQQQILSGAYNIFKSQIEQQIKEASQQIINLTNEGTNRIDAFDKALEDELEKALKQFGNGLASISSKFQDDYQAIVATIERLARLESELRRARNV